MIRNLGVQILEAVADINGETEALIVAQAVHLHKVVQAAVLRVLDQNKQGLANLLGKL